MTVKNLKFTITWILYLLSVIIAFILTLDELFLSKYYLSPGLIIGAIFPIISLLYFYGHYVAGAREVKGPLPSVLNWLLPACFLHLIVIAGFSITLTRSPGSEEGSPRSMYTSFYDYAHIFKSFRSAQESLEKDIITFEKKTYEEKKKFESLISYYSPHFPEVVALKEPETSKKFAELETRINQIPFLIALSFGFLGALVFCLRDAIKRSNTKDLYPKTYVFYIVRFIVSVTLAVTLAYWVVDDWPSVLAPLVFFLIGYFPERVIVYFDERVNKYLGIRTTKYKQIPLSMIQGISDYKVFRLREIGVADAQNLAVADVVDLKENLPYQKGMLCDWIAQSMLFVHFSDNIESLRHLGIRTIIDFYRCLSDKDEEEIKALAEKANLEIAQLKNVLSILELDHIQARMDSLNLCMASSEEAKV